MFMVAMMAAVVGAIFTGIGKATNSTAFNLSGGLICLVSGVLFLINAFSIF